MIDGLIGGKLYGKPSQRTGQSGKPFMRTPMADGKSIFVAVIAFDTKVISALVALDDGDSITLSGTLTPKVLTNKAGESRPS